MSSPRPGEGAPRSLPVGRPVHHADWGVWVLIALMLGVAGLALVSFVANAFDVQLFEDSTTTATTVWPSGNGDAVVVTP